MSAKRWTIGAMVLAAASAAALAVPASDKSGLVVHEWGTFSSFSGSDGKLLKFNPANTDLPPFVHRSLNLRKDGYSGTVSLETPVLYFYADRPITASARAQFPGGTFTEWYPRADRTPRGDAIAWPNVRVRPGETPRLPLTSAANHYYAARETDAAPVEVVTSKDGKELREEEGFLFYRGVGDLTPAVTVSARSGGTFQVTSSAREAIDGVVLVEVRNRGVRYRQHGPLAAGASATLTLPDSASSVEPLRVALVTSLVKAGLFEKEARAMVKTWESAWLGDEGTRVLSVLPGTWADRTLPLQVTPKPDALVRVMVGRHDILTPERELEIDALVQQSKRGSGTQRQSADEALKQLGRFAPPARQRAEERLAGRR